jgi:A/G-specific adenine glycosylase
MVDFHRLITEWYRLNHRQLPWRETTDPYKIWLSEIILQQTRVDQGLSYYLKFIENFPNVSDLADADEQLVLNLWQGLGYYSRARNLHKSAKLIVDNFNGEFPKSYEEVLSLKGVGDYTAAAIVSFAFDLPYAVLDGNVFRVLSRVFGVFTPIDSTEGKKEFKLLAQNLLSKSNPSLHNQAIMEFGALQCVPVNPNCTECVFNEKCIAFRTGEIKKLPVKMNKTKVRDRFFYFLFSKNEDEIIIQKRIGKDIWENMYQLPMIESQLPISEVEIKSFYLQNFGVNIDEYVILKKHILSHQRIFGVVGFSDMKDMILENSIKIKLTDLNDYPFPKLIDNFFDNYLK